MVCMMVFFGGFYVWGARGPVTGRWRCDATRCTSSAARDAPGDAMRGDGDDGVDGLDAHRRVLGVTREATIGDVRRAFLEVAKRAHPDVASSSASMASASTRGGGGVTFRDAVEAREALVRSMVHASRGGFGGASSSSSSAFGAGAARTAGTPQTKAYAAALAAPAFVVAAVVMFAFPSTKTYGLDGDDREFAMGRVHGVMNVPVNPWLKPEATRPAKASNEDRMWRRVFGGGEP